MNQTPAFRVFAAPHEFLSCRDWRQGPFKNVFTLNEPDGSCFVAGADKRELVIISFEGLEPWTPRFENPILEFCPLWSIVLPECISLSFCTMEYEDFFNMSPYGSTLENITNIYLAESKNRIFIGLPHPDKLHCVVACRDDLVTLHTLQPQDSLTCQPASFRFGHAQHRYII